MDSSTAFKYKIDLFKEIKNSVFVDPDTSLWHLAYLYDLGFSLAEIADLQREVNTLMIAQLEGEFNDEHPAYQRIASKLKRRRN